ncbi:hypothetical protein ACA910_022620 [Epithemia clementina (nom. ined.)]
MMASTTGEATKMPRPRRRRLVDMALWFGASVTCLASVWNLARGATSTSERRRRRMSSVVWQESQPLEQRNLVDNIVKTIQDNDGDDLLRPSRSACVLQPWPVVVVPSHIYTCGYQPFAVLAFQQLYPEFANFTKTIPLTRQNANASTPTDILVVGVGGFCDGWGAHKLQVDWFAHHFRGIVFHFNGESFGGEPWEEAPAERVQTTASPGVPVATLPRRNYHIGYAADSSQSVRVYFASLVVAQTPHFQTALFMENKKPRNTGQGFMIYTASNCAVTYREQAVDWIASRVGKPIHYGGTCRGLLAHQQQPKQHPKSNNTNNNTNTTRVLPSNTVPSPWPPKRGHGHWLGNAESSYQHYRFCLVLENKKKDGYITEKIVLAFVAGCIPVYYGTEEIFHVFNPNAFIYYNVSNPRLALDAIAALEANHTAYHLMLIQEPILAQGNQTMEQYFSLLDGIGHGTLKHRIRQTVCLDQNGSDHGDAT